MKAEQELIQKILEITALITDKYPELCKYLSEMPADDTSNLAEIDGKSLSEYYEHLSSLVNHYADEHKS
ncbi:MAG: hypothetical protein R2852_03200 [Bacteroidia bacterium]